MVEQTVFRIANAVTRIEGPRSAINDLYEGLAVYVAGSFFARKHRPGWDGKWHAVNQIRGTFPTGLLTRARKVLPLAVIIDERKRIEPLPLRKNILIGADDRDYQFEAVTAFFHPDNHGRGQVILGTGGGKTEVGIIAGAHVPGLIVWIVHRKELLHQTAERIEERIGEVPAMVGDGMWSLDHPSLGSHPKFVVAMPQTIARDKGSQQEFRDQVRSASMVILDECHRTAAAAAWYAIAQTIPAYHRLGMTGTNKTGDPARDLRLEAATGPVVYRLTSGQLAEMGYIMRPIVFFHPIRNEATSGTYQEVRRVLIEENPRRNGKIVSLTQEAANLGQRTLIICDTIRHARRIGEMLSGQGVRFKLLTGKHSGSVRFQARKDFKSGVLEILIATPIFDEGVDIPELEVVILAAGGKSAVRVIQRIGRSLRRAPGKKRPTIHDFLDTGNRHMMKHSMARKAACEGEGFEIKEVTYE